MEENNEKIVENNVDDNSNVETVNNENVEKPKKEKNPKRKKIIIVVVLFILLAAAIASIVIKNRKEELRKVEFAYRTAYESAINTYGDAVSDEIHDYMESNSGQVPEWDDISESIEVLNEKVRCKSTINYDGSLYLERCKVKGIDYTSDYTYGKKLEKPEVSDDKIYIYVNDSGDDIYYSISSTVYENIDYYKLVNTYNCIEDNCHGYDVSKYSKQVVIYDGGKYYLYNYETGVKDEINIGSEQVKNINFLSSKKGDYGLAVSKDYGSKLALYNLKNKEYISDFIYGYSLNYNVNELLDNNYFAVSNHVGDSDEVLILDNSTGAVIKKFNDGNGIFSATLGDEIIYGVTHGIGTNWRLYNSKFELFNGDDSYYEYAINSNGTITLFEEVGTFSVYNSKGELVSSSKTYQKIEKIVKDYVIVLDDNDDLKLLDLNEDEVVTFLNVKGKYRLHPMISGWYTENGKTGVYMLVEDTTIPYGTIGSGLKYYYIPSTGESGVIKTQGIGGYAKPVLYLYPTKTTKINVSFEKPYLLTTTYPKYNNSWNVTAHSNGDLYDENNKYYYGLYWEEDGSSNIDFSYGFYVTKENALDFLEEKTEKIGFTRREANEFIMYWLPILEKNDKNLVYFELTEERNQYNKLNINPAPDSLLRVAIHVKKVNKYTKIKEEKLTTFKRNGFVAVEWGGVVH